MDILDEDVPHRSGDKTRIKEAKKKKGNARKRKIPLQY